MTTNTAPKALTREDVLARVRGRSLKTRVVEVPKWGGTLTVQELSGTARDKYEADMVTLDAAGKVVRYNVEGKRARMLALSIIDDAGKLMFRPADILALGDLDAEGMDVLVSVAIELSGLSDLAIEAAKADFTPAPTDSSGTG